MLLRDRMGSGRGGKQSELLTVWNTLILDLQVLICARTGVGEHVRPSHHCTLGAVVASTEAGRERNISGTHATNARVHCSQTATRTSTVAQLETQCSAIYVDRKARRVHPESLRV